MEIEKTTKKHSQNMACFEVLFCVLCVVFLLGCFGIFVILWVVFVCFCNFCVNFVFCEIFRYIIIFCYVGCYGVISKKKSRIWCFFYYQAKSPPTRITSAMLSLELFNEASFVREQHCLGSTYIRTSSLVQLIGPLKSIRI